ncbi:MAG TPA: YfiR family protein, partial [Agitococcus sp.]|nr:YfiR family protein [Agitococcus sp.]
VGTPDNIQDFNCHILFIGDSEQKRQQQWLVKVQNQAVLTISDNVAFIKQGGMISLYTEANRVQFMINQSVTQGTGLKISARMLQLARVPRE